MIGVKVRKMFEGDWYDGEVMDVTGPNIFKVVYEDGDSEELDRKTVQELELAYDDHYLLN